MQVLGDAAIITLGGTLVLNQDPLTNATVDGWLNGMAREFGMVPAAGRGAVRTRVREKERYYTIQGTIWFAAGATPADVEQMRSDLLTVFASEASLDVTTDITRRAWVELYDEPKVDWLGDLLEFTLPVVAVDPLKYAASPLAGSMGVFTGEKWYETYALVAGKWSETYALVAGKWSETYAQATPTGPYPTALSLESAGDATSQRVVVTVNGPLTAGDWWLVNETTGDRLWVEVAVATGQTLVLDMHARTARLNGAPVDHLVFGDWLTLAPGSNKFRLTSGTASGAWASVEATEAYQ